MSRQLRSAEGVAPDSTLVDLENGTITLRSEKPLERARLATLVETAGFALEAVTETAPDSPRPAPRAERAARISLTLDADGFAEGEFDALLETLGPLASQRSAGVAVAAPAQLEMRVLRPILIGHHPAMDVDFSEGIHPDNTVLIDVYFAD